MLPTVTFLMLIPPLGEIEGNSHKVGGRVGENWDTVVFWMKLEERLAPEFMVVVQVISKSLRLS